MSESGEVTPRHDSDADMATQTLNAEMQRAMDRLARLEEQQAANAALTLAFEQFRAQLPREPTVGTQPAAVLEVPSAAAIAGTSASGSNPRTQKAYVRLPNPQFRVADDPEIFVFELKVWQKCHPDATPFAVMLSAFQDFPEAKQWAQGLHELEPDVMSKTLDELMPLFLTRFAPKVQSKKLDAMQSLLEGKVKMDVQKGVTEYASRFQAFVQRAGLVDVSMSLILFRRGLTQNLLAPCRVNYLGEEFLTLETLVLHAMGEEKKLKETSSGRVNLQYMHSDQTPRPKRRWNSQTQPDKRKSDNGRNPKGAPKKQRTDGGAPSSGGAGPSTAKNSTSAGPTGIFADHLGRNLSKIEWEAYKAQGLCIRCGKKGHRARDCPQKSASATAMDVDTKAE